MELQHALAQISEIQQHLARTETFRGYRSITVAVSGLVGLAAAIVQAVWLPQPAEEFNSYLLLWLGAAGINLAMIGIEVFARAYFTGTTVSRRTTIFAIEQFLPAIIAGCLLTVVIVQRAIESAWMLPGLWSILFSLGIFASCRVLPRAVFAVGAWYLLSGIVVLSVGQGPAAFSPLLMGIPFGVGQLFAAAVLYVALEQSKD
jgi:hypothetical protein